MFISKCLLVENVDSFRFVGKIILLRKFLARILNLGFVFSSSEFISMQLYFFFRLHHDIIRT